MEQEGLGKENSDKDNLEGNNIGNNNIRVDNNPDKKVNISNIQNQIKKNPWMVSTIVLGIIALILLIIVFRGGVVTGKVIVSPDDIGEQAINFFNTALSQTPGTLKSVETESGLYEIIISAQGQDLLLYFTKDGKWIGQGSGLVPITGDVVQQQNQQQPPAEVVKSDKPIVELFIMTHCPYGTQAEKGMLPVYELLGEKIDGKIRFVHYFMHEPEETETPIQICIREEQGIKYNDYLVCYLEDGDSDRCLAEVGIDTAKLDSCVVDKAEDYYAADSALSEGYGVRGSPSLIINGEMVSARRSPSAYLSIICSAFNDPPEECSEELSSSTPTPMWGWDESGTETEAQC